MNIDTLKQAGIDYDDGLRRMSENADLYHKFLNKFAEDTSMEKLQCSLEKMDLAAAYEAAHTLKGTSATLGMYELSDCCAEVCMKLRRKSEYVDIAAVKEAYKKVAQAILKQKEV
ncbi:MAG: Hpt domain-containing protein, partial [Christensenella sp.]